MVNWTELDLQKWKDERTPLKRGQDFLRDPDPEGVIQNKIVKWAKTRGYPCLSLRPLRKPRGEVTPGWPDITPVINHSKTIYIELKSARGDLRPEQASIAQQMVALGHEWYQIRSYKAFLEVMGGGK